MCSRPPLRALALRPDASLTRQANHYRTPSHAHSVLLAALHALPEQLSGSDASAAACCLARGARPRV